MAATTTLCDTSSVETNQFLFITIRVLAVVGFSYLLRLLYQLLMRPLFSRRPLLSRQDAAAEENIGIDPHGTAPAGRVSLELDFDSFDGGDLGIRMPEPAYHPRGRL